MLKDRVYDSIKTRIISQNLAPGQRINEKELMEEYDIGKTPLREVFFRLQHDGLIRRFPRSGTIVSPIDFRELREAAELRLALEGLVGELAAKNISPSELENLDTHIALLEQTAKGGVHSAYILTESTLHGLLYAATHNSKLRVIIAEQQCIFSRMWFSIERSVRDLMPQVQDWRNISLALHKQDAEEVIRINREHFRTFYNYLKSFF